MDMSFIFLLAMTVVTYGVMAGLMQLATAAVTRRDRRNRSTHR
jgi:hypothetical protein